MLKSTYKVHDWNVINCLYSMLSRVCFNISPSTPSTLPSINERYTYFYNAMIMDTLRLRSRELYWFLNHIHPH